MNNKIVENPILREIVFLGYGTMISKYCVEKTVCPAELIKVKYSCSFHIMQILLHIYGWGKLILLFPFQQQPFQDLLAEAVAQDETQDIILLLKVLGNAGLPASLKPITKILPIHGTAAASLPMRVHADAIMALRNIAKKEPRMVSPYHRWVFQTILVFTKNSILSLLSHIN